MSAGDLARRTTRRMLLLAASALVGAVGASVLAGCGGAATATVGGSSTRVSPSPIPTRQTASSSSAATTSAVAVSTSTAAKVSKPAGTLTVAYDLSGVDKPIFTAIYAAFATSGPGRRIEPVSIPFGQYGEKVTVAVAGGVAPDIVYSHPNWFSSFVSQGFLVDLAPYLSRDRAFDLSDFYPGVLAYLKWNGKLYGIPYYSGPAVFYYNKSLLQKVGAPDPNEQEQAGKWNWQAFLATARQTTTGSGAAKTFGYGSLDPTLPWIATWVWSGGGHFWNPALTASLLDQPAAVSALQFQAELRTKYTVVPTPADHVQGGFNSGRIAMIQSGRFAVPGFKTITSFELGTAPVPQGPVGRKLRNGPNGWCIMQASKDKDLGWSFLTFAVSAAGQAPLLASSRPVPVRKSLTTSPAYVQSLQPWESAAVYADASEHVEVFRAPGALPQVQKAFTAGWNSVLAGKQSMQTALTALVQQADALIKQS